jgi:hypothetical protein
MHPCRGHGCLRTALTSRGFAAGRGFGTDATAVDTSRHRAFSSNWDGTLSVIDISAAGHAVSLGEVPTQPQARTMAVDSASGRVYLVAADRIEVDPSGSFYSHPPLTR